jgi:hypothetical protein
VINGKTIVGSVRFVDDFNSINVASAPLLQSYPGSRTGVFSVIENEQFIVEKREYLYRSTGDDNWYFPFILEKPYICQHLERTE